MRCNQTTPLWALAFAAATLSCTTQKQAEPSSQVLSARIAITAANRVTYTSVAPAELKASFGATPSFMLTIHGTSGAEAWSVTAMLSSAQAAEGRAALLVTNTSIAEGLANVTHLITTGARAQASAGTLNFAVTKGRISGAVTAAPAELAASVVGDTSVSCWVPRSSLAAEAGATPQGTTNAAGDDSEVLVEDRDLATPPCSALRLWRHD